MELKYFHASVKKMSSHKSVISVLSDEIKKGIKGKGRGRGRGRASSEKIILTVTSNFLLYLTTYSAIIRTFT